MAATGGTVRFSPTDQALLDGLLAPEDIDGDWHILDSAGVSDPSDWRPLCDADPFENFDALLGRVSILIGDGQGADDATLSRCSAPIQQRRR